MGKEKAERIQTSILNKSEKKLLVWLAARQPAWVTSDMLTYFGVFGALVYVVGCGLANLNVHYLWLATFGLVLHWYGDSLDGTLARERHVQRPVYGFFIDHTLDAITTCMICIGAGISPMFRLDMMFWVLAGYLCLSIYTYVGTIVKGEFRLTYGKLGPTECRLILIILGTLYMYTSWGEWSYTVCGQTFGIYDFAALFAGTALFMAFFYQFLVDRKAFAELDPLKPATNKD